MATKAQLIEFIIETFVEESGSEISKAKLESYKKKDLEEFIAAKSAQDALQKWLKKED